MEKRNELIKELFELHKLLAEIGEIRIGYGFSENYNRLEKQVKNLTIPVVGLPKGGQLPKRLSNEVYNVARMLTYEGFVEWWDSQGN